MLHNSVLGKEDILEDWRWQLEDRECHRDQDISKEQTNEDAKSKDEKDNSLMEKHPYARLGPDEEHDEFWNNFNAYVSAQDQKAKLKAAADDVICENKEERKVLATDDGNGLERLRSDLKEDQPHLRHGLEEENDQFWDNFDAYVSAQNQMAEFKETAEDENIEDVSLKGDQSCRLKLGNVHDKFWYSDENVSASAPDNKTDEGSCNKFNKKEYIEAGKHYILPKTFYQQLNA